MFWAFFLYAVKNWSRDKMPVQIRTSALELNQEEVTAIARHKPQVCAVEEHLLHHEQSIRAVGDHLQYCNQQVYAVGTTCFLSQRENS